MIARMTVTYLAAFTLHTTSFLNKITVEISFNLGAVVPIPGAQPVEANSGANDCFQFVFGLTW